MSLHDVLFGKSRLATWNFAKKESIGLLLSRYVCKFSIRCSSTFKWPKEVLDQFSTIFFFFFDLLFLWSKFCQFWNFLVQRFNFLTFFIKIWQKLKIAWGKLPWLIRMKINPVSYKAKCKQFVAVHFYLLINTIALQKTTYADIAFDVNASQ